MGRILFLDDMEHRHTEFKRLAHMIPPHDHEVVQVWTAEQAIKRLKSERFDQVFLDHDLSHEDIMVEVGAKSKMPTGMTVVDHIMTMQSPPLDVIVHSCNGPAAWQMAYRLAEHPSKIRVRRLAFPDLLVSLRNAAL
jgi:hypothetical protein